MLPEVRAAGIQRPLEWAALYWVDLTAEGRGNLWAVLGMPDSVGEGNKCWVCHRVNITQLMSSFKVI